ncbi:methylenetetrahydrofolate reductase domain-containing protein [Phthorimaea operculella]|nr:methylenetetrahydrofolate reductase domain-containing protein [Phthorimaea operculella]
MSSRITDLVKVKEFTYSFEVTPNITFDQIDKLAISPAFFSITWHSKSHGCSDLDIAPLKLASHLKSKGENVCLHLSCDLMKKEYLDSLLKRLQEQGICNIFVILGESYDPGASEFKSSKELVQYIRKQTGDYFCIGVAGYPDDPKTYGALKEKVENGANFILTQAFTEFNSFKIFVKECEKLGITIPVIPGIDVVKKLVIDIKKSEFGVNHAHLYTMNKLDKVQKLIKEI